MFELWAVWQSRRELRLIDLSECCSSRIKNKRALSLDDDPAEGERILCLSQLLATLVPEIPPPQPTCKHTHVENALDGRESSYGEGFNESSRCADEVQLVFAPLPTLLSHLLRLWQPRRWWTHCSLTFFHQQIVRLRDQIFVEALLIT